MNQKKQTKYPPYWNDDRSSGQKQLAITLAQKLSEINHARIKPKIDFKNINPTLFILVRGVPPNKNEFIDLKFPGKVIIYKPPFFDDDQSSQSRQSSQQQLNKISMDNTCEEINKLIIKQGFNQAVFVYHSFGGSIVAWFCNNYPQKVKGLICLGGTVVRFYPIVKQYTKAYLSIPDMTRQKVVQNYELVYSLYDERTKNQNKWTRFKSKQQLLSFTLHNDPNTMATLFDKIRKLPLPILMVYGNKDQVLTKQLCTQSMVFMSYMRKEDEKNICKDKKERFLRMYGNKRDPSTSSKQNDKKSKQNNQDLNLQQKFIYLMDGGHSIHISSKNNKIIQPLIDQYLYTILGGQTINETTKPKL